MNYKNNHALVAQRWRELLKKLPSNNRMKISIEEDLERHKQLAQHLTDKAFDLSFIGAVGVGKTTAISYLQGLLDKDNKPLLRVSSGRTTLCEVKIECGQDYEILIEPCSLDELKSYLYDFGSYLYESAKEDTSEGENEDQSIDLTEEYKKALRNMCGIKKSSIKVDGKRKTIDPSKELAKRFETKDDFIQELLKRAHLENRNKVHFRPKKTDNGPEWLKSTFKDINHCSLPDIGLPKRIQIKIPKRILNTDNYDLSIIDTKGVDQNIVRPDIEQSLQDSKTITVLCSLFSDAPSATVVNIINMALDSGINKKKLINECIILVLDKVGEAENVDDGEDIVEDKNLGREFKQEAIFDFLKEKGLEGMTILFYDSHQDDSEIIVDKFKTKVEAALKSIEKEFRMNSAAYLLFADEAKGKLNPAREKLRERIEDWLKEASCHLPTLNKFYLESNNSMSRYHVSSVRASMNRAGKWHNYNLYLEFAHAARQQLVNQIRKLEDKLEGLVDDLSKQDSLADIHSLIEQIRSVSKECFSNMYNNVYRLAHHELESELYDTSELMNYFYLREEHNPNDIWVKIFNEWGRGTGYRNRVQDHFTTWFKTNDRYLSIEDKINPGLKKEWQNLTNKIDDLTSVELFKPN